ncbi:MAG: damage-control phosphatase ARMT1 family protein [Myxococcales bacterium]|nr:damage-control phosphatase ARMT1 family protein [Polyangiaceae bacterium]MDW8250462.1 damage-control phosphatase ARMT1 family protein [Myxococcales bacterium]
MNLQRPPPIRTDGSNRFAHHSMRVRIPNILRDVQQRNPDYAPSIHGALEQLRDEILGDRPMEPLLLPAIDASAWSRALSDREHESWLHTDWFFAETYFYRRVLQATRFWETGRDPYRSIKSDELADEAPWRAVEEALALRARPLEERLPALCRASLWGNRMDLSYTASAAQGLAAGQDDLLVDDTEQATSALLAAPGDVHLLLDNAGTELLLDLVLTDALLDLVPRVLLHVKMVPTFVSDATAADVWNTLAALEATERRGEVRALGARLCEAFHQGRLGIHPGLYWNSHRFFFDMPPLLRSCLAEARLVISKGDANYRRFTGDALWLPSTPFPRVASFVPAPLLALRTLKSDSIAGLPEGLAERLDAQDPTWRHNGRRGVALVAAMH